MNMSMQNIDFPPPTPTYCFCYYPHTPRESVSPICGIFWNWHHFTVDNGGVSRGRSVAVGVSDMLKVTCDMGHVKCDM